MPRHARQPVRNHLGHRPGLHPGLHRRGDRFRAVPRYGVASADLILCGHTPGPTLLRIALPNDRTALVVRSSGHLPGEGPGPWHQGICVLTHRGGPLTGFARWSIEFEWAPFEPRDPNWTEASALRQRDRLNRISAQFRVIRDPLSETLVRICTRRQAAG